MRFIKSNAKPCKRSRLFLILLLSVISAISPGAAIGQISSTQARIDRDIAVGYPVIIHVSVALADNQYQGIMPVPESIGNGQSARNNLYWGARYGLKTFLIRDGGWRKVDSFPPENKRILERLVLHKEFIRNGNITQVYLVADAWDGRAIADTTQRFLRYNAGYDTETIKLPGGAEISAGGAAHMQAYIGHNLLMDIAANELPAPPKAGDNPANDAVMLACKSRVYFEPMLTAINTHALVMTEGLMAPEAYTLNAVISAWMLGLSNNEIKKAAAQAYDRYQKTGKRAAERLFGVDK